MANSDQKTLLVLTHLLGIFVHFIGALIILLASNDKEVKRHARNALNWQFSALIYGAISIILAFILIGFVLLIILAVLNIIFCIIAAVKASEGKMWKYPLSFQFFKVN